jgi:hypothetical protein
MDILCLSYLCLDLLIVNHICFIKFSIKTITDTFLTNTMITYVWNAYSRLCLEKEQKKETREDFGWSFLWRPLMRPLAITTEIILGTPIICQDH